MEYRETLEIVGIIELVINILLFSLLLFIAIKHNISKSNGGIDVNSSIWINDWNGHNVKLSL